MAYFTELDPAQGTAFWGFYAKPGATPGTGTRVLYQALELAFSELRLNKLSAEVLATNAVSVNLHKKVGFTQEGCFLAQHIDIVRLGLLASEWPAHRERLRARVEATGWAG